MRRLVTLAATTAASMALGLGLTLVTTGTASAQDDSVPAASCTGAGGTVVEVSVGKVCQGGNASVNGKQVSLVTITETPDETAFAVGGVTAGTDIITFA